MSSKIYLFLWTILLLMVAFISCNSDSGNDQDLIIGDKLFQVDTMVSITNVDNSYPIMAKSLEKISNSDIGTFSVYDMNDRSLRVYNAYSDTQIGKVKLNKLFEASKDDYARIHGYYYHNLDSIFVTPFYTQEIFHINGRGKVIDRLDVPKRQEDSLKYNIYSHSQPPIWRNGHIITGQHFYKSDYATNPKTRAVYFSTPIEVIIDAKTGKVLETAVNYPELYRDGNYYKSTLAQGTYNRSSGTRVYTFIYDEYIRVARGVGPVLESKHRASSRHYEKPDPFDPDSIKNSAYRSKYTIKNSQFLKIYYDPYQQLYYRILKHGDEYYNDDHTVNANVDAPWSIIVLDEHFDRIYEQVFPAKEYNFYLDLIITAEGILIHLHPQHEENREGEWNYHLFKINEDEIDA